MATSRLRCKLLTRVFHPVFSPRRAFAKARVEEARLGEARGTVPYVLELVPGAPKQDGPAKLSVLSNEIEE
jgi:hypothetical protein